VKKIILAVLMILVVGVAGWAAATYVVGEQVEKRYFSLLEQNGQWGTCQWTSQSYERGFLKSKARSVVEFQVPIPVGEETDHTTQKPVRLTFEHSLRHGPLPAWTTPDGNSNLTPILALIETRLIDIAPADGIIHDVLEELDKSGNYYAFTLVGLSGDGNSRLILPPFKKRFSEEALAVNWGGLTFDMQFTSDMQTASGILSMPLLHAQTDNGEFLWDGLHVEFDLKQAFPLIFLGHSDMQFANLKMQFQESETASPQELVMKGLKVSTNSDRNGNAVNCTQTLELARINVAGETYGPGLVEVVASNFNGEALSRLQMDVQQVYRNSENLFDPEEMAIRLQPLYTQFFMEMVSGSPEIDLRHLQFTAPSGQFDGSLRVKVDGEENLLFGDLQSLMENLEAEATITVDERLLKAMFSGELEKQLMAARERGELPSFSDEEITVLAKEQIDAQLEALEAQQYLLRGDGRVLSHAVFNRGELMVNDKLLPLF